ATQAQLDQLAAILSRPEFQAAAGRGWLDSSLDPVRAWLSWLLLQILKLFGQGVRAGGTGLLITEVVVGLAIVLVAAVIVRRLLRGVLVGDVQSEGERPGARRQALDERSRAQALAAAGDARGAVHHLY